MLNYIFYVLEASVFKKNPFARVYINDTLVDEHELFNSNFSAPLSNWIPLEKKLVRVIKFYTLDEILDIKIQIFNQDSNYTNGFMTKSTLVNLSRLYVVTEHVLRQIKNINKNFKLKNEKLEKNIIENFARCIDINFAGSTVPKDHERFTHVYTVGGDGLYQIQLCKKLGFWLRKQDFEHGIRNLGWAWELEKLVDKYKKYENQ